MDDKVIEKTENKPKKKTTNKIIIIVALVLVTVILLTVLLLPLGAIVGIAGVGVILYGFGGASRINDLVYGTSTEFKVPGVSDGFVQQGFDYYEGDPSTDEDDRFLVSGYMKDGSASRVYVLNKDGKVLDYAVLKQENPEKPGEIIDYTGHCGGIAHDGGYLYISNDDNDNMSLDVFNLSDILAGKETKANGSVFVYQKPAFCYVADGKLYTGNFHREETRDGGKEYLSPDKVVNLDNDDKTTALMTVFELDHTRYADNYGVASEPCEAYTIPSQVQGMCMTKDGNVVFSTSWGVSMSHLYFYNLYTVKANTKTTTDIFKDTTIYGDKALNKDVTLYVMGSEYLYDDVKAPPMAEGLVYLDGKIYVMNESASNKYVFGKLIGGEYVHSYQVD